MEKQKIKILDCTLRDGGYYNNWDFDNDLVNLYLNSMEKSSIDVIEIGFRSPAKRTFMGPYVYSIDNYLEEIPIPKEILIGVMINANEFLNSPEGSQKLVKKLFNQRNQSQIGLVRIAINFDNFNQAKEITSLLKNLGYMVGLNLMQSHGKENNLYTKAAKTITQWKSVDVLYFADSLGNMNPLEIKKICNTFLSSWDGPLGVHTHNNKGLALINSLTAIENGATWCDSTVLGMGRGAGNVTTESLLMEATHLGIHSGNAHLITPCLNSFHELKKKYQWGPNIHYHYAANFNIHPTFVQFLLKDPRYGSNQIEKILKSLSQKHSTSFSEVALNETIYGEISKSKKTGTWNASGWLDGNDVLLVGTGPSVEKYNKAILKYIKQNKPIVIFLNINPYLPSKLADATVIAHENRASLDSQFYGKLNHPLIMPLNRLGKKLRKEIKDVKVLDYGLSIKNGAFKIEAKGCFLQWPLAAAYALSVITQANANQILMVGFDGYETKDPRQEEMNEVFASYMKLKKHLSLKSLTPTIYNIKQGSIFEPKLS